MSGTWQKPTITEPVPLKIMRQNKARATKTKTGISQSGSVHFGIRGDFPGTTNTAVVKGKIPLKINILVH